MEEEIEVILTLEIEEDKNQITPILEKKKYYDFYVTKRNNANSSSPISEKIATRNELLICKKILETGEVSNILKYGKELVEMKIGIKQVVSRHYCTIPKKTNTVKSMSVILLHTIIIFFTIYGILELILPNIDFSHKLNIAIIPSIIDFLYYSIIQLRKKWRLS